MKISDKYDTIKDIKETLLRQALVNLWKGVSMPKGVFNKGLLQIFMVLLLVISIMFVSNYYIYKSSMDAMFEQAEMNNKLVVKGIIQSFEESFKEINDIIYTVGTLPYRVYDTDGHDNINMNKAYLLMKNASQLINQDYIYDFIVFFKDSDLALTLSGTESFESIFSKKYKNSKYAPEFWRNFAATKHSMQIIPADYYTDEWNSSVKKTTNLLAIVASNQINTSVDNIVVFVDLNKLYKKVNKQSMMQGTSLMVLDKDKNAIISTDGNYDITGLENIFFNSSNQITVQEGKYTYNAVKSVYNNFVYINKVPYRYEGAISTIRVNKIILLATTFAGIFISLLLSMYIYRPVRKILGLVGMKEEEKKQNHYKHIYNSIEKMQLENKLINTKIDNVKEEVMRSIFFKMIDDITFYKDMKNQIDTYFKVIFSSRQFLMVAFEFRLVNSTLESLDDSCTLMVPEEITKNVQKAFDEIKYASVVVFYLENMQVVALVGVNEPVKRENLLNDINKVKDDLQNSVLSKYSIVAAVSRFYTDAQSCKDAFEDIKMCFAYRNIRSNKSLIDMEKIEYSYDIYMPLEFDEKLSNYLLSGNSAESIRLIKDVVDTNVKNNVNYIKFDNIVRKIFNDIINAMIYLKIDREEILYAEREFRHRTNNYNHFNEITEFFKDLVEQTTEKIRGENQSKLDKNFIMQYIQLHYAENLYLDKMAEIFDTSPKYFSNYFKKAFGINFVEYLNKVRMSHAKELLKSSEIPVSEIGEKVGYLNSSTFASTFKKYCGITPTEFRKEYKA